MNTHANTEPRYQIPQFNRPTRRLVLIIHIICSVGWIGVDACLLLLAITGITTHDTEAAHATYTVMGSLSTHLGVPLALASLVTGVTIAVGTPWGLLRHYWVTTSLLVTIAMTLASTLALAPMARGIAGRMAVAGTHGGLQPVQGRILVAYTAELLTLCLVTALNVVKPWGLSRRGRRHRDRARAHRASKAHRDQTEVGVFAP